MTSTIPRPAVRPRGHVKQDVKELMLRAAGVRRFHIVGCARSGTTMLHYALLAFADTVLLHDSESAVWRYPSLLASADLVRRFALSRRRRYLVTKRNYRWFEDREVERMLYSALEHGMFLVSVVRDPRDVLTSSKRGHDGFYVDPARWAQSVSAADTLRERLDGRNQWMTLRYEDMMCAPDETARAVMERTGLSLRPGITSWAHLKDNIALLGRNLHRTGALHTLRNFDASSVGRWRLDPAKRELVRHLLEESPQRAAIRRFMADHGYPVVEEPASV